MTDNGLGTALQYAILDSPAESAVRVSIIDENALVRSGIQQVLAQSEGIDVERCCASLTEMDGEGPWSDVIILDAYPEQGRSELSAVKSLSKRHKVLVVSLATSGTDILRAIEAGADGYLSKVTQPEALVTAVRTVAADGTYLSAHLRQAMTAAVLARKTQSGVQELSSREREALTLVAEGYTHGQAARRMGVQTGTFDTYVKRVRKKLGLGNKAELARRAIELGLISPQDDD